MASFLDKFKVNTAIEQNTTLDLSCQHITTANWMELQPVYIKEMVPGETIEVLQQTFTRLAPLAVPTLGRANIHNRAFFVPMRTIFPRWDDFITQSKSGSHASTNGSANAVQVLSVPSISNSTMVKLFIGDASNGYRVPTGDSANRNTSFVLEVTGDSIANADIIVNVIPSGATSTTQIKEYAYNFTPMGRNVNKILQSLGYNIIWSTTSDSSTPADALKEYFPNPKFSALPILGLFKVFIDWYWPAQYVGDTSYNYIESIVQLDNYTTAGSEGTELTPEKLYKLFTFNGEFRHKLSVNYDSDYLVSAFDEPTGPASTGGLRVNNYVKDINLDVNNNDVGHDITSEVALSTANDGSGLHNGTPFLVSRDSTSGDSTSGPITQFALNALKAMTDYMQRHNLVGVRALDRFYARFGISLSNEKLKRSNYIGAQNIPLQFGDVMSNADTDGAALGQYAGKGLGYGEDKFSFKSEDYGYFIICSSIVPVANTFEGVNRMVMHRSPLDFWTPEYDQLGNQAISKMEVYVPMNDSAFAEGTQAIDYNKKDLSDGIFGYTPRYSEYKIGLDKVTGDFRCKSLSNVGETSSAWYLNRSLDDTFQQVENMVHSKFFVNGGDSDQFNRIFNIDSDENDKFYMIHNFNVTSNSPMHSLYDSYEFDSKGKTVVADVNGVKVN